MTSHLTYVANQARMNDMHRRAAEARRAAVLPAREQRRRPLRKALRVLRPAGAARY